MAGIDIMNSGVLDGYAMGSTTNSGSIGSSVLGLVSDGGGGDWMGLAAKFLGGATGGAMASSSQATSTGGMGQLNTSGWVVGEGDAVGGGLGGISDIPWYGWAGIGLAVFMLIKKGRK
jgi:hypothetical protein